MATCAYSKICLERPLKNRQNKGLKALIGITVRSKAVALLLLICGLVCFPLVVGVLCLSLFCCTSLCALSCFAIVLMRKRELVVLFLLSYGCLATVNVL